jgi:hypothetical protein
MKSVMLKGVEVKIGDSVRFINDVDLYKGGYDGFDTIIKPELGRVYTVRGFSDSGGFYLKEIRNQLITTAVGGGFSENEPGFAVWRFDPANPLIEEIRAVLKSKKKVNIKIEKEVIESLDEVLELMN